MSLRKQWSKQNPLPKLSAVVSSLHVVADLQQLFPFLYIVHYFISAVMKLHENRNVDCVVDYQARDNYQNVDYCQDGEHCQYDGINLSALKLLSG